MKPACVGASEEDVAFVQDLLCDFLRIVIAEYWLYGVETVSAFDDAYPDTDPGLPWSGCWAKRDTPGGGARKGLYADETVA